LSRSDHEFVSTSTDAIQAEVEAMYTAVTGTAVAPSSPAKLFCAWVTSVLVQAYTRVNLAGNANLPSRAEGADLDALGELFYAKVRPAAQAATVMMRFTISGARDSVLVIPAGTRVTNGFVVFATEADASIPIGDTSVDIRCVCESTGAVGNDLAVGTITSCVDPFPYYSSCANVDVSAGGADEATDEEYYSLMVASEDAYSCAGARGAYEYFAKSVSTDIEDVCVNSPTPGQVNIYALMSDGTPAGAEIKAAIEAACSEDETRPLTDHVVVSDPDVVNFNISLTYYINRASASSASAIEDAVNAAVQEYIAWQTHRIGRDINPSKLVQLMMAAGVKRVNVVSPGFVSLKDGTDHQTPELAQVGTISITNGGYEDE